MLKSPTASLQGQTALPTPPPKRFNRYTVTVIAFLLLTNLIFRPFAAEKRKIQYDFPKYSFLDQHRRDAVQKEFVHAWTGYQDHAWMADGLMPHSGGSKTQFCSWSATLVDSLDTLWIMGLYKDFDQAVNATMTIDFKHNAETCTVSLFESTIRYLGGLLGAYDLSGEPRLLSKLVEVGDMLHSAFDTSNGMPCSFCHLASKAEGEFFEPANDIAMADIGSLSLEFARLSQIATDPKYLDAITLVTDAFARTQNQSSIPGLWPEMVDATSISSINDTSANFATHSSTYSLGALSDSSYEYLVKAHLLLGSSTSTYKEMWLQAASQIRRFLLFRAFIPSTNHTDILFPGTATRSANSDDIQLESRTQHLSCFAGGLFALGSRIFSIASDMSIGTALTEGCIWSYLHSPSGIMPETYTLLPCPGLDGTQCEWNEAAWDYSTNQASSTELPPGYYAVGDPKYNLRPEAIESIFILYRLTGNPYYRDIGWTIFQSIITHTRTAYGHAALSDVTQLYNTTRYEGGIEVEKMLAPQLDDMESFWFVETLKYFYLLFSEVDLVSLDEFVLNTEAHPLRLTGGVRGF